MPSPASNPARRRAWPLALVAALLVLVLPGTALAAPGWNPSQAVPQSLTDGTLFGALEVEVDRAGNAHAIWAEAAFPNATVKTATKPVGGSWSAATPLIAEPTPGSPVPGVYPTLTVAPDGTLTAIWQDLGLLSPSTGIWASTRAPGEGWSTPVNLSAGAPAPFGSAGPRAVTDSAGNTTIVWQAGLDMRAATRLAGEDGWSAPVDVYTGTAGDTNNLYGLALDVAVDGAVTAVFRVGTTSDFGLFAKTRPSPGAAWGAIETVIGRGNRIGDPQLAISRAGSSTGEATALWYDDNTGGVKVSSRPPNGGAWSTPAEQATGTGAYNPKLVYDRHGNAVAAWQGSAGIQTMRRAAGAWSDAATIAGAEGGSSPQLTAGSSAEIDAVWNASDDTATVVYGSRFSGGAWSTPAVVSEAGVETGAPGLAAGPIGGAEAAWPATDTILRGASYEGTPELGSDWTANGLPATFDLRSWIRYLGGNAGVEVSGGATRPDVNDQNSFRFGHADAWRQQPSGETVVAGDGQIRFTYPAHYIDNRIADPQFRIAADGLTGRVVADGQGSGDMADAINGNWTVEPYQDVHLLDLDVDAGSKVVSADGQRTTWIGVPAYITAAGAPYLSYAAGTRYGFFTITAPTSLPTRSAPPAGPGPGPGVVKPPPGKPKPALPRIGGSVTKTGARGLVVVKLDRRPGRKAGKTYRVRILRKGKAVATGTARGRTLRLHVREVGKGKRARYPKLKGAYTLVGGKGVKGVAKTRLVVRRPA